MEEVPLNAQDPRRFAEVIGNERAERFVADVVEPAAKALAGRSVVNVNSTAAGGGVAELLQVLLPYARGAGIDARWLVIDADTEFFAITKRLHNHLYGGAGDAGQLGAGERDHYERVLARNAKELATPIGPGDVVILHDPQTLGLAAAAKARGATVLWRCHVGIDTANEHSEAGWSFLRRYLDSDAIDAAVFSRRHFAPPWLAEDRIAVIPPSIDPFAPKNAPLSPRTVRATLTATGLIGGRPPRHAPAFTRRDGTPGRVQRACDLITTGPLPEADVPLIVQISRWDRLKDMVGVMRAFSTLAAENDEAQLVLAGPVVTAVADDPEGAEALGDCWQQWRSLPHAVRRRVTLVCVPMADVDENATIVNALQRHAAIVTQKSLAEGFGLTVAEAMYKSRPVVASAVGGIRDQIVHGECGLLVDDPTDLDAFAAALGQLLDDPEFAKTIGAAAYERARDEFLTHAHLARIADLLRKLVAG